MGIVRGLAPDVCQNFPIKSSCSFDLVGFLSNAVQELVQLPYSSVTRIVDTKDAGRSSRLEGSTATARWRPDCAKCSPTRRRPTCRSS